MLLYGQSVCNMKDDEIRELAEQKCMTKIEHKGDAEGEIANN